MSAQDTSKTVVADANPEFTPSQRALTVVGLTREAVATDEQIIALVKENDRNIEVADYQNSVLVYILTARGHNYEWILKTLGIPERTAVRRKIEGMAILRTGETKRTTQAIRKAGLSDKVVDGCTTGTANRETKIASLEKAAFVSTVQKQYQPVKGGADAEITEATLSKALDEAMKVVVANEQPTSAVTLIDAVPHITEALGLKPKEQKRGPQDGDTAPKGLEFHMKAALADLKKIVAASDDQPYVPTPQDMKALMDLCQYLDITLDVTPEVAQAVEALAK